LPGLLLVGGGDDEQVAGGHASGRTGFGGQGWGHTGETARGYERVAMPGTTTLAAFVTGVDSAGNLLPCHPTRAACLDLHESPMRIERWSTHVPDPTPLESRGQHPLPRARSIVTSRSELLGFAILSRLRREYRFSTDNARRNTEFCRHDVFSIADGTLTRCLADDRRRER
jgi:hypothetical protein